MSSIKEFGEYIRIQASLPEEQRNKAFTQQLEDDCLQALIETRDQIEDSPWLEAEEREQLLAEHDVAIAKMEEDRNA